MLEMKTQNVILLSGKGTAKEKREVLQKLNQIPPDEQLVLVATGRYVGEGFDLPRLDTLFLAMPISWKGTLAQYAGRLHRNYEGKQEVLIYDYVDLRILMLERMYQKRLSGYAAIGYHVRGERTDATEGERIFSQEEYWLRFAEDLQNAQKEILIVSPYLHMGQVKRVLSLIPAEVKVSVVTSDEASYKQDTWEKVQKVISHLEANRVQVTYKPQVYQRYAVLDRTVVWYGGINFLGFEKATNGTMRLCSTELAKDLLDLVDREYKPEQMALPDV